MNNNSIFEGGVITKIKGSDRDMSKSHRIIGTYIINNPQKTIKLSVTDLADECNVSEATIIRFCQTLNYQGFQDLKLSLAQELRPMLENIEQDIKPSDDIASIAKKLFYNHKQLIRDTLKVLNINSVSKSIEMINKANRILFCGMGSSGIVAKEARNKFLRIGLNCDYFADPHMTNIRIATFDTGDLVIGFSCSGSTKDTVNFLNIAKNNNAKTVAVTSHLKSPITKIADIVLLTSSYDNPVIGGAIESSISQLYIVNLLFIGTLFSLKSKIKERFIKTAKAVSDKLY